MKIKGVAGGKDPHHRRGDPIQLPADEKAKIMASEVVINGSEEGWKRIPIKEEVLGGVQILKGRTDVKNPDPTQYKATVQVTYKRLDLVRDRLFSAKTITLEIRFQDSKDDLGMPDMELLDSKIIQ